MIRSIPHLEVTVAGEDSDEIRKLLAENEAGDVVRVQDVPEMLKFPAHKGDGDRMSYDTVRRACTRGTRLPDGRVVRLASIRFSNLWVTSRAAIERYIVAVSTSAIR